MKEATSATTRGSDMRRMKRSLSTFCAGIVCATCLTSADAVAAVDLQLRVDPLPVGVGMVVDIGLYAVSSDNTTFTAVDALLQWEPDMLKLVGVENGEHSWFLFGFKKDVELDGLNADCGAESFCAAYTGLPFNDGNAMLQALSFVSAVADEDGLLIAKLQFLVLAHPVSSAVTLAPSLGSYSTTRVLQAGAVNVTGELVNTSVLVVPSVRAPDVYMPAGGRTEVLVLGDIAELPGEESFGVTLLVKIDGRAGNEGSVTFTPEPPVDIVQRGDPWPGIGLFNAFDSNAPAFSEVLNGSIDANATYIAAAVAYSGPLASFPIVSSANARGVWSIRLCQEPCGAEDGSFWSGAEASLTTAQGHGRVIIVALGDGGGDGRVDLRDTREFLACFTGGEAADPPLYSMAPEHRCSVYDFDHNGVINHSDYSAMLNARTGP